MAAMKQTLLHGLFPAVRAEVLRLLFANRGQELYTREFARLISTFVVLPALDPGQIEAPLFELSGRLDAHRRN